MRRLPQLRFSATQMIKVSDIPVCLKQIQHPMTENNDRMISTNMKYHQGIQTYLANLQT